MKNIKRFFGIVLTLVLAFSVVGCGDGKGGAKLDMSISTADNVTKVLRVADAYNGGTEVHIELAKGETEGAQIILRPNKNVKNFTVTAGELKSGTNVIAASAWTVYQEMYTETYERSKEIEDESLPLGEYPDALIPMEYAVSGGINNIESGTNQGVYVSLTAPETAAAGTYSGKFTVTADGNTFEVPANVVVYDFVISQESHSKTSFLIWKDILINGELDSSLSMYKTYYDFLLDYRINAYELPAEHGDTDGFVASADAYFDNPKVASYGIPFVLKTIYDPAFTRSPHHMGIDYAHMKESIRALAEASTNERNLLSKAYYYLHSIIDEFDHNNASDYAVFVDEKLGVMENELVAELDAEGFFKLGETDELRDAILNLPHVATMVYGIKEGELLPTTNGITPQIDAFRTDYERQVYQELMDNGDEVWWYSCVWPINPFPSYHIDDHLISARELSVMQKYYGIEGNLFWAVNGYVNWNRTAGMDHEKLEDLYTVANRAANRNGDGYLMYPGKPFGSDKPFPSLRLETIRDGQEDYEYLWQLEQEYEKLGVDYKSVFDTVADKLFTGMYTNYNSSSFYSVRRLLARLIELVQSDAEFAIDDIEFIKETVNITFSANENAEITLSDAEKTLVSTANGRKTYNTLFSLTNENNALVLTAISGSYTGNLNFALSGKAARVSEFDDAASLENIKVPLDSTKELNTNSEFAIDGNSVKVVLSGHDFGNDFDNKDFEPSVTFAVNGLGIAVEKLYRFTADVYNDGDAVQMFLKINQSNGMSEKTEGILLRPGWNKVIINQFHTLSANARGRIQSVEIALSNLLDESDNAYTRTLYIDNAYILAEGDLR